MHGCEHCTHCLFSLACGWGCGIHSPQRWARTCVLECNFITTVYVEVTVHTCTPTYILAPNTHVLHCRFASEVRTFLVDVLPRPASFQGRPASLHRALTAFCEHFRADIEVVCHGVSAASPPSASTASTAAAAAPSDVIVLRFVHAPSIVTVDEPDVLVRMLYDATSGSLFIVKLQKPARRARSAAAATAGASVDGGGSSTTRAGSPIAGTVSKHPRL